MKLNITLSIDTEGLFGIQDISLLLKDALGEFGLRRAPVAQYVANRYEGQSEDFRLRKEAEVLTRVTMAEKLHMAVCTARFDPLDDTGVASIEVDEVTAADLPVRAEGPPPMTFDCAHEDQALNNLGQFFCRRCFHLIGR